MFLTKENLKIDWSSTHQVIKKKKLWKFCTLFIVVVDDGGTFLSRTVLWAMFEVWDSLLFGQVDWKCCYYWAQGEFTVSSSCTLLPIRKFVCFKGKYFKPLPFCSSFSSAGASVCGPSWRFIHGWHFPHIPPPPLPHLNYSDRNLPLIKAGILGYYGVTSPRHDLCHSPLSQRRRYCFASTLFLAVPVMSHFVAVNICQTWSILNAGLISHAWGVGILWFGLFSLPLFRKPVGGGEDKRVKKDAHRSCFV